ncbi:MAG TPA: hypothetical protein ACFYEM_02120 [Candidatus Hypogeohydataceae bacterium YC40]
MDWGTHVVLSAKLLDSCGLEKGSAIYSVIPVIDKEPPHFHRVYAHILSNQPEFLEVAMELFGSEEVKKRDFEALRKKVERKVKELQARLESIKSDGLEQRQKIENNIYAYKRITEETPIFLQHAEMAANIVGDKNVSKISCHKMSAAVSLLSHIYFDLWNNPVQVFLPGCSYCSAYWKFWEDIDYMKFRSNFYKPENITAFRKEIAQSQIWNCRLKPEAVIKALIIRLGELSEPRVPYEIVDMSIRDFMRYMEINEYQRADKELDFCQAREKTIQEIIYRQYKRP